MGRNWFHYSNTQDDIAPKNSVGFHFTMRAANSLYPWAHDKCQGYFEAGQLPGVMNLFYLHEKWPWSFFFFYISEAYKTGKQGIPFLIPYINSFCFFNYLGKKKTFGLTLNPTWSGSVNCLLRIQSTNFIFHVASHRLLYQNAQKPIW